MRPFAQDLSKHCDPERTHYTPGHFNELAGKVAGGWLQNSFLVGAVVCLVGPVCKARPLFGHPVQDCYELFAFNKKKCISMFT